MSLQTALPLTVPEAPRRRVCQALGSDRALGLIPLLLVALVAGGVYFNSLRNGFALDDTAIIQYNSSVVTRDWIQIWSQNYWPAGETTPDVLYRPLTIWSYLANEALAPGAAWAFHLVNVLLHVLVTLMCMSLAWRVCRSRGVAIVAGLLFAVHPIHTEVVANIVGRAELLAAFWSLAALLVFLPTTDLLAEPGPARPWWHGWLVAACFLLALLCKETPAALVGAIGFVDLWRWSQWPADRRPRFGRFFLSQGWRYYLPGLVALGVYLALRIHACGLFMDITALHPIVNPLAAATIPERLLTPFMLLAKYLGLLLWPATLAADYSAPSLMPTANPLQPLVAAGLLVTALGAIVSVHSWRRAPRVVLLLAMFAASYALVANFLRIGTIMGERLFYWPSVFALILTALALVRIWEYLATRPHARLFRGIALASLLAAVLAMSWRTIVRNTDWQDNITLAIATARDNPDSAKACTWAGTILVTQTHEKRFNDFGEQLLKRAIELYPTYGQSYWELAKFYGRQGNFGTSVIYLAQDARWRGGFCDTRIALTAVKDDLKKRPVDSYLPEIEQNLQAHPDDPAAYVAAGLAYAALGRNDDAGRVYKGAIERDRAFDEAAAELGQLRLTEGRIDEGLDLLRKYVMRVRHNAEARCMIAAALIRLDPVKYPWALAEAEMNLDKAAALPADQSPVRALRTEAARRRSAAPRGAARPLLQESTRLAGGGA